jgi:hypothetical protein
MTDSGIAIGPIGVGVGQDSVGVSVSGIGVFVAGDGQPEEEAEDEAQVVELLPGEPGL